MAVTNEQQISNRFTQWLEARADARTREMVKELTIALQSGAIELPTTTPQVPVYAGGVNYAPNSDLKFSKKAIETIGTLPSDVTDINHEAYRFYRQVAESDLVLDAAHALKATGHSGYAANEGADAAIPVWDRVNGYLVFGSEEAAADQWDIALQLYNNDVKPGDKWYVQFVLGVTSDDLVPEDLEMYCGFWQKSASDEGWISGGDFDLSYEIPPGSIRGTQEFNYVVVATTDAGVKLVSQTLNVPDAPDTLDDENVVRLRYGSATAAGYVEFKIYRENVATGDVHFVTRLRNVNQITFDDDGDNLSLVDALPTGEPLRKALAHSRGLAVGAFGETLLINNFTILIPKDYDWSQTLNFSQFLRFGFMIPTALNRQIRLDKIYAGPSFNKWSDSPLDAKGAIPSTSQTGGLGTGGGGIDPPPPGGGGCVRIDTPVLRLDFDRQYEWLPYRDVPDHDLIESGEDEKSVIKQKLPTWTKLYYEITFSNGVMVPCTRPHRIRVNKQGHHKAAMHLKVGDPVWGWTKGKEGTVTIISKKLIRAEEEVEFGTFALVGERSDGNHWYVAGFSDDGDSGVFHRNRKADDPPIFL